MDASGNLVISTTGRLRVSGYSARDEDLSTFVATSLGSSTSGSFSILFDGSDVGLSNTGGEDVDAAHLGGDGNIYLSTLGDFSVTGLSGFDDDVIAFTPSSLGSNTSGSFALFLDGSAYGLSADDVDGVFLGN